jgi:peptidyl-prolyl cis-trans isomerase D
VLAPDETDPNADRLRQTIGAQAGQGIAQDLYGYFAQALINSAGLSLDQAAINAVQSQFR